MSEEMTLREEKLQLLRNAVTVLREYFDTVQIFATFDKPPEATIAATWGEGNWYARYGQIVEWINKVNSGTYDD